MSAWGWYPPHLVDNTDTQYLRDQHWQQCSVFRFFFYFLSICLSVSLSVYICLQSQVFENSQLLTSSFIICEPCFRARIKNVTSAYVSECLGILPKNQGETLVSGFGSEQRLQQQWTPAYFVGHVCSMVVLWNVCFLSVQPSLFVSAWLWATNHSTTTVL